MSDYLTNLIARQLGLAETVRPRLVGRFEPPVGVRAPQAPDFAAAEVAPEPEPTDDVSEVRRWRPDATRGDVEGRHAPRVVTKREEVPPTRPTPLKPPEQDSIAPPREKAGNVASVPPRASSLAETVVDSSRAESLHALHTEDRAAAETFTPRPHTTARTDVSPPVSDKTSADSAPLIPPDDNAATHQSPATVVDERGTRLRRQRAVSALSAAEPIEKVEPGSPPTPTPAVKPLTTAQGQRVGRRVPAPAESHTAPQAAKNESPQQDGLTPHRSTPPVERRVAAEQLDAAATYGRAAVEPVRARQPKERHDDAPVESRVVRPAHGEGRAAALTIEPLVSRRITPRAAARDSAQPSMEAAPAINVTIGRVEVRAAQTPAAAPRRRNEAASRVSLDEYLRRRAEGGAR